MQTISNNVEGHMDKKQKSQCTRWIWFFLLLVILSTSAIRIRLLSIPLERDEGEYAYAGQLILQGVAPYDQVYNMKLPGIYVVYALIMAVFGQSHTGIHAGLLVVNVATVVVLFLLAKEFFGPIVGIFSSSAFAFLSLGRAIQGVFANSEHFVIFVALVGLLLLVRGIKFQKLFSVLAGAILLGLGFVVKQHGIVFIMFGGVYLFFSELRRRPLVWKTFIVKIAMFVTGALLPFGVTCLVLWRLGVFEKFWFWTFEYARTYITIPSLSRGMLNLDREIGRITGSAILLWLLAGVGLTGFWCNRETRKHSLFIVGFVVFSLLAICPGLYFRPHYFILLLPVVSLLIGIGIFFIQGLLSRSSSDFVKKGVLILLVLVVLLQALWRQRHFLFLADPTFASYMAYPYHPFPESLAVGRFIKENSSEDDLVAVIGSEPEIYFYSNRRSATGYIYTYALMEPHQYALEMQEEMIREIESAFPKFLVIVNVLSSWMARPESEQLIKEWMLQYSQEHYYIIGVVDILEPNRTIYRLGDEYSGYVPQSDSWIVVLKRRS